ncbi:MAG: HDIG domain-containing protein [Spirochaetaceae bacterium]|nr:HDIG domain-containing protein [Spirochaetaceae bacterium]MCF7948309.1 HDIG domain-containing protein [Spirochaetia bacterium]MCF7951539.1 HDIG domain-containing protein [Spirochaetaceae bacterium]
MDKPTRDDAWNLLNKYVQSDNLIKHCVAVEGVMRYLARKHEEDEEKWGVVGLIHDVDYQQYPDQHCTKVRDILEEQEWPEEYIRAVQSHGYSRVNDIEPQSLMEKSLFAIDELTGLVTATALVRPSKSVLDTKAKSVKKKWKDKGFSAAVDRDLIQSGVDRLGVELTELISDTIMGMRDVADEIGLKGEPQVE